MIVATAGHVDHGKTRLVAALTGVDTDTLAEEKRRGLSIDLGFAYLPLGQALSIGFIDVPGHERFMRNALCGLGAADYVLLVVAADDGIMPQTREHLAIIDLLGMQRGAIVVSKLDRVPPERVDAVDRDLDRLLAVSSMADWPRFALSAESGQGVQALRDHLAGEAESTEPPDVEAAPTENFRMPIDRCFEIRGAGLVVTGTVFAGRLRRDDAVTISGSDLRLRARGMRVHERERDIALPGQRCAVNLAGSGLRKAAIRRGDWLASPRVAAPVTRFDARIRIVDDAAARLRHWTPVHLHLAAAETSARVALLQGRGLGPGEEGLVQLVCERPLGAAFGDYLVIRDQGARRTLGGGRVLDIYAPRRGRASAQRLGWLREIDHQRPEAALSALLATSNSGVDLQQFAQNRNLADDFPCNKDQPWVEFEIDGRRIGFAKEIVDTELARIEAALRACQRNSPRAGGFDLAQLRAEMATGPAPALLRKWIEQLRQRGKVEIDGAGYRLVGRPQTLGTADNCIWQAVEAALSVNNLRPMSSSELAPAAGVEARQLKPVLDRLQRAGLVSRLSPDLWLLPQALLELQGLVVELQARAGDGEFSVAEFRDASGIGRNRCIEILESFDARGITRRGAQGRRLLPAADSAFARLQPAAS